MLLYVSGYFWLNPLYLHNLCQHTNLTKIQKPAAAASASAAAPVPATPAPRPAATPAAPPPPAPAAVSSTPAVPATPTPAERTAPAAAEPQSFNDPSALAMGSAAEASVREMEAMGFARSDINAAMRAAFFNPDRAIEYLLTVSFFVF